MFKYRKLRTGGFKLFCSHFAEYFELNWTWFDKIMFLTNKQDKGWKFLEHCYEINEFRMFIWFETNLRAQLLQAGNARKFLIYCVIKFNVWLIHKGFTDKKFLLEWGLAYYNSTPYSMLNYGIKLLMNKRINGNIKHKRPYL